jgi:2-phospho-L-lactate guanylyltransferase
MAERGVTSVVLVPLKSFTMAKTRLEDFFTPAERADLSRWMATRVLAAAAPLECIVVCDDREVAAFAREHGAAVHWTPGSDLNRALSSAVGAMQTRGVDRVVIAAGDLPFAHDLGTPEVLSGSPLQPGEVLVVGDRHNDGTNVMSFSTADPVTPSYGPGSLRRHVTRARRSGLAVREVYDEALAWDIDTHQDLLTPPHLEPRWDVTSPVDPVGPTRLAATHRDQT